MNECKVSIIIPVYNVENYLIECLDSAINQTLKEIEIIAINDGSTDGSPDILEQYHAKYGNIKIINQQNKGQSAARNIAIKEANGEYIYFLDSDDYIHPELCEVCYNTAQKEGLDLVTFDASIIYEDPEMEKKVNFNYSRSKQFNTTSAEGQKFFVDAVFSGGYSCSPCLVFFKRDLMQSKGILFYEGIIHEDEIFMPMLMISASKIQYIPNELFFRRVRAESTMTKKKSIANAVGYYTACNALLQFETDRSDVLLLDTREALHKKVDSFLVSIRAMYLENRNNIEFQNMNNQLWLKFGAYIKQRGLKTYMSIKFPSIYRKVLQLKG